MALDLVLETFVYLCMFSDPFFFFLSEGATGASKGDKCI